MSGSNLFRGDPGLLLLDSEPAGDAGRLDRDGRRPLPPLPVVVEAELSTGEILPAAPADRTGDEPSPARVLPPDPDQDEPPWRRRRRERARHAGPRVHLEEPPPSEHDAGIFDVGYSDDAPQPGPISSGASRGPARIYLGLPGDGAARSQQEASRIWDASALAAHADEVEETKMTARSSNGGGLQVGRIRRPQPSRLDAPDILDEDYDDADILDDDEDFHRVEMPEDLPEPPDGGWGRLVEELEASDPVPDPSDVGPSDVGPFDADPLLQAIPADGDEEDSSESSAPLFPEAPPAPAASRRPWWASPSDDEEPEDPDAQPTGEHRPALPPLDLGRPRLEDELARPLPEEESSGIRRAPWQDPDPWVSGAFRRVRPNEPVEEDEEDEDSPPTLRSRRPVMVARPANPVPDLQPLDGGETRRMGIPGQLVVGALLVALVVVVVLQVARMRNGGISPLEVQAPRASVAGLTASPAAPVVAIDQTAASEPASALPPLDPSQRLGPANETGRLQVTASPGATVYIDGKRVGRAPIDPVSLAPGMYEVRVNGRSWKVHVGAGRLSEVDFSR